MKTCTKCNTEKPLSEYHKDKHSKTGYTSSCNDCRKAVRTRAGAPKPKYYAEKDRWRKLLKQYGVTEQRYQEMFDAQNGVCAICENPEMDKYANGTIRDLSVDHCHNTGKVRGLLCNKCNNAIGKFKDDTEILKRAINYLVKHRMKIAV